MTKEESYKVWYQFAPLWKSWARKLSYIEVEREDLYQESYCLLVKALEHYDQEKGVPFEAYYKMVLYRWGKKYRQKKRDYLMEDEDLQGYGEGIDQSEDVLQKVIHQEVCQRLEKGLKRLKPSECFVIRKFYLEEKPLGEIASELGITAKAVAGRKERALKKLEKIFRGI